MIDFPYIVQMESDPACEFVASILLILRLAECWDIAILGMKAFIYCMTVTGFAKRHEAPASHGKGVYISFLFHESVDY